MKTDLPKVLVPVCERPMIEYVLDSLASAGIELVVVVVGYRSDLVRETLQNRPGLTFVEQTQQLGTGHAVMVCREVIAQHPGSVLVVAGDSPLMQIRTRSASSWKSSRASRPPACWGPPQKTNRPAWDGSFATNQANSWALSKKKMPLPSKSKLPK